MKNKPVRGWINLDDPVTFFPEKEFSFVADCGNRLTLVELVPVVEQKSREGLTKRQREILEYAEQCIREKSHFPSIRQIGEQFGIKSPNGVVGHLKALAKKQFIVNENLGRRCAWRLG